MSIYAPIVRSLAITPGWAKNELWRKAKAIPSLDLRFADSKSLVDATSGQNLITFTRASSGTYVDSAGVIQTASTDVPRFDHNPTTGESLGLLVEEQRTNLLLRSEEFDNAAWIPSNGAITANAIAAPNGSTSADLWLVNSGVSIGGNGNFNNLRSTALTVANATAYTISFYLKSAGYNVVRFGLSSQVNLVNNYSDITVNLSTLAVTQTLGTGSITPVGNGWFRVTATGTTTGTTAYSVAVMADGGTANGTSGIYVWGAQLEAGSFPTSYIPTTSAAATRSADVASITGTAFSSWYRQDEGTVFVGLTPTQFSQAFGVFSLDDGTTSERLQPRFATTGAAAFLVVDNNATQANVVTSNTGMVSARTNVATSYAVDLFKVCLNGGAVASDTLGTLPSPSQAVIGNAVGLAYSNAPIRRLTYFPTRLSDPVLQALTQ